MGSCALAQVHLYEVGVCVEWSPVGPIAVVKPTLPLPPLCIYRGSLSFGFDNLGRAERKCLFGYLRPRIRPREMEDAP